MIDPRLWSFAFRYHACKMADAVGCIPDIFCAEHANAPRHDPFVCLHEFCVGFIAGRKRADRSEALRIGKAQQQAPIAPVGKPADPVVFAPLREMRKHSVQYFRQFFPKIRRIRKTVSHVGEAGVIRVDNHYRNAILIGNVCNCRIIEPFVLIAGSAMAQPQDRQLLIFFHTIGDQYPAVIIHTEHIGENIQLNGNHCHSSP